MQKSNAQSTLNTKSQTSGPYTPISPRDTTVVMKYIVKRIASKEPQFKSLLPHTLRHTFATRCMNPKILQIILGHFTIQITMNLYWHVTDDILTSEMSKFEAEANNDNQKLVSKWCNPSITYQEILAI